jgi:hypothetical protein
MSPAAIDDDVEDVLVYYHERIQFNMLATFNEPRV